MQKKLSLKKGTPYPLGVMKSDEGVNFAAVTNTTEPSGVLLYAKSTRKLIAKLPFRPEEKTGNICCGRLDGFEPSECLYNFYSGDREYTDPYARAIFGTRKRYGEFCFRDDYDWEKDTLPEIPYADSVFYLLHVKGFTMHRSSGVEKKGTFRGIQEKIPYLKELGITTLELMPVYEFEEKERIAGAQKVSIPEYMQERYKNAKEVMKAAVRISGEEEGEERKHVVRSNFWGYKAGSYFAPKQSYSSSDRPDRELKDLIKALHQNGMEIILQFYFPKEIKQGYILEVLKYWILRYHIDGVHVKGEKIPITLLATEPLMGNRKLLYENIPLQEIYGEEEQPVYKNLAFYRDDFMYDMRKFLKGDDNMLPSFVDYTKRNSDKAAIVNFMTNYYGFTLEDLVSYDRKHNEMNGEDNRDGTDYNFSWNCGAEGRTRRKSVNELRLRQKKNAIVLLLLSQGTPLLRAGDEFGHTQRGNNNAYCQDNEISWLDWSRLEKQRDFYRFVKELIGFRKKKKVFSQEQPLSMTDYRALGYPDLSLHGEEAWKVRMAGYEHHLGMLYCGRYIGQESWFYVAYNMHWQRHYFGLPALPEHEEWELCMTTGEEIPEIISAADQKKEGQSVCVPPRTICLFQSRRKERRKRKKKNGGEK